MAATYKKILPEDIFLTIFEREATEQELWQGYPAIVKGNRPTGCHFMDCFAQLVYKRQHLPISTYAKIMGLDNECLGQTIKALTGIEAAEWRDRYVMLCAYELLLKTDKSVHEIGKRLGFAAGTTFSRYFATHAKASPKRWRYRHK